MEHITHNKKHRRLFHVSCSMFHGDGFTMVEIIIYIALLAIVLVTASSFMFYFLQADAQSKGDREALENARRALEIISYEINGAKSIYTSTTTSSQLSLETLRYLPSGEADTYIDFFICGTRLCLKKESQTPIFLTSETTEVSNLAFTQIANNGFSSIKIDLTLQYGTAVNGQKPSVQVTSTAGLRSY